MVATVASADMSARSQDTPRRTGLGRWLWICASVGLAAVASAFFGINDYSAATSALVATARRNSQRFEAVYADAAETRLASLRMGVDLILANPDITGPFIRDDRPALIATVLPLFTGVLQPRYGTNQFNFWTPPAKLYLRANDLKEFGTDGTAARRSVVASIERHAALSGMEAGLGGRLGIRAMAPILDGTRLVGVVELGDDLVTILKRARASTGVEFAAGLDRKRSDEVERVANKATDAIQGTDVFFEYSSEETARLIRGQTFNAREAAGELLQSDGRSVFIRPFAISNFAGIPTVVVATVFELSQPFADARQSAATRGGFLFLVLAIGASVGVLQFQKIQQGFARVVFGERRKLQETTRALEQAQQRLRDVDLVKQGFFTTMVAAVSGPLQAVHGQMRMAIPELGSPRSSERLDFALNEIGRLARLLADYRKIELFRQKLVADPAARTALADVVAAAMATELARFRRLPGFSVTAEVPADLPSVRVNAELLRHAVAGLVGHAAEAAGAGTVRLAGAVDEAGWVTLSIRGSAFKGMAINVLLDESRQFIARLSGQVEVLDANSTMMALVLARAIVENAGGRLDAAGADGGDPGFVVQLPAAA